MLLFSTILDINDSLTKEAFKKLVIEWNAHSTHPENIVQNMTYPDQLSAHFGTPSLWMDFIEYTSEKEIENSKPSSHRSDVLQDILDANDYEGLLNHKSKGLKEKLRNFKRMDSSTKKTLKDLGFTIDEATSRHYKRKYYDDDRNIVTYGKTPSDSCAGINNALITIKKVF